MSDDIKNGVALILKGLEQELGLDLTDENFTDTPARVARMYREILSGVKDTQQQIQHILNSTFPCHNDHLILVKDIEVFSLCPHHLLPVHYKMHIGYLPQNKVIGISKLARLAEILARRPILQEQLVDDISTYLMDIEGVLGAGCVAEAVHYCMAMRGVKQPRAKTMTSSLKGVFLDPGGEVKQEFLKLIFGG